MTKGQGPFPKGCSGLTLQVCQGPLHPWHPAKGQAIEGTWFRWPFLASGRILPSSPSRQARGKRTALPAGMGQRFRRVHPGTLVSWRPFPTICVVFALTSWFCYSPPVASGLGPRWSSGRRPSVTPLSLAAWPNASAAPVEPVYLTVAQVAALLQVSERTVYRWASEDPTLPVLRVGGTLRFPRARLLRWLEDHEQGHRRRAFREPVSVGA